jgi:murein DD-endopeptidase MepM/ murein hydrolase activator NlpD
MDESGKESDHPTLMAPFRRVVPKHQQETAETPEAPRAPRARVPTPARQASSKSILPIVIFAGCAVVLLITVIGIATVNLLLRPQEVAVTEVVTEATIEEDLVAPEQMPIILPEGPPAIIDLSGDPVVLPRRQHSLRQVSQVDIDAPAASALGLAGPLFQMSDDLLSPEIQLVSGVTAAQQNFAFFQGSVAQDESAAESESGEEPSPYDSQPDASTIYYIDSANRADGPGTRDSFLSLNTEEVPAEFLARRGWSEEHARLLQDAMTRHLGIESFQPGDEIAIAGPLSATEPSIYVPGRLVLYRGNEYVGTLALTDRDDYVEGADPWFGERPFDRAGEARAVGGSIPLLDAIYGAAVRNEIPATVVGEAILTLSRAHDLSQAVKAGDSVTLLYTPEPRDGASGFGKVVYIRIAREPDAIECYVFQPERGRNFVCVSGDGHAKDTGDAMTTPVSGVLGAKFGPRKDPDTGKTAMHPGVSWAAPVGTPVVAAFSGTVESAGDHPDYGNFLKIAHSDGRVTAYGHLQRFASHIEDGVEVEAGGLIGYVGKTGRTSEAQLFFQLLRNGQPADPFGTFQRAIESGGAVDALIQRIIHVESAGNPKAKNPLSTATGLGQFIESTWLRMINTHRPDLAQGRTREQILALRTDPDIATEMVAALARGNANYLRSRGQPVTSGNLYLSHFLGPDGAVTALSASPGTPLADLFPAAVINANPFLRGWSASDVVNWAARKMQQKAPVVAAAAPQPPRNQFAGDAQFLAMKQAIETALN